MICLSWFAVVWLVLAGLMLAVVVAYVAVLLAVGKPKFGGS